MAATDSIQCFGRMKKAVAVTYCKRGRGLIKINGGDRSHSIRSKNGFMTVTKNSDPTQFKITHGGDILNAFTARVERSQFKRLQHKASRGRSSRCHSTKLQRERIRVRVRYCSIPIMHARRLGFSCHWQTDGAVWQWTVKQNARNGQTGNRQELWQRSDTTCW